MSTTTHLATTITTIYAAVLNAAGLTPTFAAKVVGRVAERVELMFDALEREDFVARFKELVEAGYAVDVAAHKAACEIVPDYLVEAAALRGGGWDALYGDRADGPDVDRARPDYRQGTAGELIVGDGLRLVDFFHAYAAPDLDRPLVVTKVTPHAEHPVLLYVEVIDRGSMVHEALGNLPDGVAEMVATLVFNTSDAVLIRR